MSSVHSAGVSFPPSRLRSISGTTCILSGGHIRYRYRTAGEVRSQAGRQPDDGSSVPMAALWLVGVVVVLGGLTMVWARL